MPSNPLKRYLDARKENSSVFARRLGVAQAVVSRWRNGQRTPDLEMAFRIEDVTEGAVPARSWCRRLKVRRSVGAAVNAA